MMQTFNLDIQHNATSPHHVCGVSQMPFRELVYPQDWSLIDPCKILKNASLDQNTAPECHLYLLLPTPHHNLPMAWPPSLITSAPGWFPDCFVAVDSQWVSHLTEAAVLKDACMLLLVDYWNYYSQCDLPQKHHFSSQASSSSLRKASLSNDELSGVLTCKDFDEHIGVVYMRNMSSDQRRLEFRLWLLCAELWTETTLHPALTVK